MRNAPEPDLDRIWTGIVRKARKRRAKRNAVRMLALAMMAILCAGFYTVVNPIPVRALGNRIWYSFGPIFQGHSGTIQMSYTNDLGPNPPQQPSNIEPESDLSLADVAAKCPFKLLVPGYLPSGFKLSQVKYYPEDQKFAQVEIYYSSGAQWLIFAQWNAENQGSGYSYDTDDTVVSDVTVCGYPAKLYYRQKNGGYSQLVWVEGEQNYRIGGGISQSDIQHVASSLHELSK
jgi:predicted Rdx family selenoprotein